MSAALLQPSQTDLRMSGERDQALLPARYQNSQQTLGAGLSFAVSMKTGADAARSDTAGRQSCDAAALMADENVRITPGDHDSHQKRYHHSNTLVLYAANSQAEGRHTSKTLKKRAC